MSFASDLARFLFKIAVLAFLLIVVLPAAAPALGRLAADVVIPG